MTKLDQDQKIEEIIYRKVFWQISIFLFSLNHYKQLNAYGLFYWNFGEKTVFPISTYFNFQILFMPSLGKRTHSKG